MHNGDFECEQTFQARLLRYRKLEPHRNRIALVACVYVRCISAAQRRLERLHGRFLTYTEERSARAVDLEYVTPRGRLDAVVHIDDIARGREQRADALGELTLHRVLRPVYLHN